ncbi:DciA family protein [uncultured Sphingomonas sp.]|uniref:DUF721 domain-containing protein n=1 Tax=uncultured Sphingomonas sp. TaxID=158754 RepID=UPI0025FA4DE4|nr:DciA family protein [uncultured Sphingomonas sp.]
MSERKSRNGPPEEPRRRGQKAVADLLPEIGGAAFRRFGFVQSAVVSRWAEIVGPRYAEVSAPESIRFPAGKRAGGVLTVVVQGAHAPMMQHVEPVIIERTNRFFGYEAVTRVTMKQGHIAARSSRAAPPSVRPVPAELGESLRGIADPELRECLSALAGAVAASSGLPRIGGNETKRSND